MSESDATPREITLEEWRALLKSLAGSIPDFPLRHEWEGTGVETVRSEPEHEPQPGIDVDKDVRGQ